MGHPSIIEELDQVREVYNVDRLAQAAALAALNDQNYFNKLFGQNNGTARMVNQSISKQ